MFKKKKPAPIADDETTPVMRSPLLPAEVPAVPVAEPEALPEVAPALERAGKVLDESREISATADPRVSPALEHSPKLAGGVAVLIAAALEPEAPGEICAAKNDAYCCTLRSGHAGYHHCFPIDSIAAVESWL